MVRQAAGRPRREAQKPGSEEHSCAEGGEGRGEASPHHELVRRHNHLPARDVVPEQRLRHPPARGLAPRALRHDVHRAAHGGAGGRQLAVVVALHHLVCGAAEAFRSCEERLYVRLCPAVVAAGTDG